jgi:hypothetical protein
MLPENCSHLCGSGFRSGILFVVVSVDEDRIFFGDPSPNDVATFPCPYLLPLSSSVVGRSKAGDGGPRRRVLVGNGAADREKIE